MAEQRIEVEPVNVNTPLPTDPLPAAVIAQSQKTSAAIGAFTDEAVKYLDQNTASDARKDAAQLVDDIGRGVVLPPSSFKPAGWNTRTYSGAFEETAQALYFGAQSQKFTAAAGEITAKYPLDPAQAAIEIDKKKQEMLQPMGAEYRPYMSVRFNGIGAQHVSAVTNAAAADNQRQVAFQADQASAVLAQQMGLSAGVSPSLDKATLEGTFKGYREQFDKEVKPLLVKAGQSPIAIENYWERTKQKATAHRVEREFETLDFHRVDSVTGLPTTDVDHDKVRAAYVTAENIGKGLPNQAELQQIARAAIGMAVRKTELGNAGTVQRQNDATSENTKQEQLKAEVLRQGLQGQNAEGPSTYSEVEARARYQTEYNRSRLDMLTNPAYSPAQRVQNIAMLDQVHGVVNADSQRYFATQVLRLSGEVENPRNSEGQKANAVQEMERLGRDPEVLRTMSPALQAHMSSVASKYHRQVVASDFSVVEAKMAAASLSPSDLQDIQNKGLADGTIGPTGVIHPEIWKQKRQAAEALWERNNKNQSLTVQALQQAAKGIPATEAQRNAVAATMPFDIKGVFDINNADHVAAFDSYFQRTGVVPENVKKGLESAPFLTSPVAAKSVQSIYNTMVKTLDKTYAGANSSTIHAEAKKLMGAEYAEFGLMVNKTGPEMAAKAWESTRGKSDQGNMGKPEAAVQRNIDASFSSYVGNMPNVVNRVGIDAGVGAHEGIVGQDSFQQMRTASGRSLDLLGTTGSRVSAIRADVDARSVLDPAFAASMAKWGGTSQLTGSDKEQAAWAEAFAAHRDKLELADDPEHPGEGIIRLKTTRSIAADAIGVPASQIGPHTGNLYAATFAKGYLDKNRELQIPGVDYDTVEMKSFLTNTGHRMVQFSAMKNTSLFSSGVRERLFEVPADDPMFNGLGAKIAEHASGIMREMAPHWPAAPKAEGMTPLDKTIAYAGYVAGTMVNAVPQAFYGGLTGEIRSDIYYGMLRSAVGTPTTPILPDSFIDRPIQWLRSKMVKDDPVLNDYLAAETASAGKKTQAELEHRRMLSDIATGQLAAQGGGPHPIAR